MVNEVEHYCKSGCPGVTVRSVERPVPSLQPDIYQNSSTSFTIAFSGFSITSIAAYYFFHGEDCVSF